uniref:Amino acid transporter transmembrane domain-containing protein n=1 Tax=Chrysotila carterae TaxID=13221 RepID=A0A7S4F9R1_CHRCT
MCSPSVMVGIRLLALTAPVLALQHTPSAAISSTRSHPVKPAAQPVLLALRSRQRTAAPLLTAAVATPEQPPQGATVSASIINLAKNIVGSGVLTLAAGVAAFSGSKLALIPSLAILLFLSGVSAYSFSSIARVGEAVGGTTYRDTWAKVFPPKTAILPAATVTIMTFTAGLAYSIIIGDSFASIASLAGLPPTLQRPNVWIVLVSTLVLFPLCLLRDLSSLAIGSVLGTAGTLYTALFMALRCIDGSYAPGGKFFSAIAPAVQPRFVPVTPATPVVNLSIFVLISMLATAFLAHYNAPKFYNELAPPKDGGSKVGRFNLVCGGAFGLAALLCGLIMSMGFLTFGAASQGLILNNYATKDTFAFLARMGIGASIIFSYPLNFAGFREGVLSMTGLGKFAHRRDLHIASTVLLMLSTNGLALFMKDLGLIAALGGAILGSALVYIFPALMFIANGRKALKAKADKGENANGLKAEVGANYALLVLGFFLAVVGAVMSLK